MDQLRYCTPDFEVQEFGNRQVMDEIKMVMTAFDCVLPDNSAIYCSSDVTTGRRFYEMLVKHQVHSRDELEGKIGVRATKEVVAEIIRENIERGRVFTENIRQRGHINLINPGPFTAPDFAQQHYHYLWEWVILKKVYETQFNEGWEYSNGCTLEYAISTRKRIPRLDHVGNFIGLNEAVSRIERAQRALGEYGIQASMLEKNLAVLRVLLTEIEGEESLGDVAKSLASL